MHLKRFRWRHALAFVALSCRIALGGEARTWTTRGGQHIEGELLAVDGLRATLGIGGLPKSILPIADLSPENAARVREQRLSSRHFPLVDPRLLAPWPADAGVDLIDFRLTAEVPEHFRYESPNFTIESELKLPL